MLKRTKELTSARNLWEMTLDEFSRAASAGKLVKATGRKIKDEDKARTPLTIGELNNYSREDIAHFYVRLAGGGTMGTDIGYQYLLQDALADGHTVPSRILKEYPKIFKKAKSLGLVRD